MEVQNELHCIATSSLGYARDGRPARDRVKASDHPLFQGTGLGRDDGFEVVVGFEWDSTYEAGPEVTVLLECDDIQATGKYDDATETIRPAQAVVFEKALAEGKTSKVFSAGAIRWAWGLDGWQFDGEGSRARVDARSERLTANVLAWMGARPRRRTLR